MRSRQLASTWLPAGDPACVHAPFHARIAAEMLGSRVFARRFARVFALVFVAITGCGRFNFDPLGAGGDGGSSDTITEGNWPCPISQTASDPIVITGTTKTINGLGVIDNEPNVTVTALTGVNGSVRAMTTSDNNGRFSLSVPTGGTPIFPYVALAKSGFLPSMFAPGQPIDRAFDMGDAWMTTPAGMGTFYNLPTPNLTREQTRGTILVDVEDCSGSAIAGATIDITPAPELIMYSGALGIPSNVATSTGASGRVWALNAPAGTLQLTASKAGVTFLSQRVDIVAGDIFMGTSVSPVMP